MTEEEAFQIEEATEKALTIEIDIMENVETSIEDHLRLRKKIMKIYLILKDKIKTMLQKFSNSLKTI